MDEKSPKVQDGCEEEIDRKKSSLKGLFSHQDEKNKQMEMTTYNSRKATFKQVHSEEKESSCENHNQTGKSKDVQ